MPDVLEIREGDETIRTEVIVHRICDQLWCVDEWLFDGIGSQQDDVGTTHTRFWVLETLFTFSQSVTPDSRRVYSTRVYLHCGVDVGVQVNWRRMAISFQMDRREHSSTDTQFSSSSHTISQSMGQNVHRGELRPIEWCPWRVRARWWASTQIINHWQA